MTIKTMTIHRNLLLLAAALLLAACSAVQLGYRNADTFLYWWLDKYADFDDAQSVLVRRKIADYLAWHRRNELPRYASLLDDFSNRAMADITPTQVCDDWARVSDVLRDDVRHTTPDAAALAVTLSSAQVERVKKQLDKNNREFDEKYRSASPAKLRENRLDAATDRLEWLYGSISSAQQAQLGKLLDASPWDGNRWAAERRRRQQELLQLLSEAQRQPQAAMQQRINAYWDRVENVPDAATQQWLDTLTRYNCRFTAQAHDLMTPQQRRHARDKLRSLAADLRELASQP